MISSKAAIGIAAGVCGTLLLGYCIYFDKQRHDDPEFKRKLRESKWGQIMNSVKNKLILIFSGQRHLFIQNYVLIFETNSI